VERLGRSAQARLVDAGRLGPPAGEAADGPIYVGDRVLATRNHVGLGIRNGERGRILHADLDGVVVAVDGRGERLRLPSWYVERHVRQGYAVTCHRAQGQTVEWTLALVDDAWYRELGYSALSRARRGAELYLAGAEADDPVDHQPPDPSVEPVVGLTQRLARSRAEQAALRALPELPTAGDPESARAASDRRMDLAARLAADDRPEATGRERARLQASIDHLDAQQRYRERLLGIRVRYERPAWAMRVLGPLPTSRAGEAAWINAAGVVAVFRERWMRGANRQAGDHAPVVRQNHAQRVHQAIDDLRRTPGAGRFEDGSALTGTAANTLDQDADVQSSRRALGRPAIPPRG
jgi:hypothetical protein